MAANQELIVAGPKAVPLREMLETIAQAANRPAFGPSLPLKPMLALAAVVEDTCKVLKIDPPIYRRRMDFYLNDAAFDSRQAQTLLGWQRAKAQDDGRTVRNDGGVRLRDTSYEERAFQAGVQASDIAWLVPHQANVRIINAACDRLGIPHDRAAVVLDRTGNTSSASIPLALADALDHDRVGVGVDRQPRLVNRDYCYRQAAAYRPSHSGLADGYHRRSHWQACSDFQIDRINY